jgi:SAM-dependent methyltransferase
VKSGAKAGTGFDISAKFVQEATRIASLTGLNCRFVCTDVLAIGDEYKGHFDMVICTVGTLCWFRDLKEFFAKVSLVLKHGGILLLNDGHPFTNCVAMEREKEYDARQPDRIVYSYFKGDEWVTTDGLDYYGNTKYKYKPFISFSHTLSDMFNAMVENGLSIERFYEFDYSLDAFELLNKGRVPLSMIVRGRKTAPTTASR